MLWALITFQHKSGHTSKLHQQFAEHCSNEENIRSANYEGSKATEVCMLPSTYECMYVMSIGLANNLGNDQHGNNSLESWFSTARCR